MNYMTPDLDTWHAVKVVRVTFSEVSLVREQLKFFLNKQC